MAGTTTELIKEKLDVVEVLKTSVVLQPAGKNFKGLCPFHREKTPSFMVSPERQTWHCFGCGLGGDIFSFVMRYENVEFSEALKILAERAGIQLSRVDPADYRVSGILYDINSTAREFFKTQLVAGQAAQKYLDERGLQGETITEFELGWAPNEPEALSLHLLRAGFRPDDIIRAGLAFKSDRGLQIDRFRGRIMFPIHNHLGKVVGFTGRILPQLDTGTSGKYVNSPETPIFNKSKLLYGFWKSKEHIREEGRAFLVEGQMDFLLSWQAGVKYAAASSGTAFTAEHLKSLRRFTDSLLLSFDNDEAGFAAMERAVDMASANDFSVKIVTTEQYKDPAEAAAADPAYLKSAIAQAQPALEVYFHHYIPEGVLDYRNRDHLKKLRTVLLKVKTLASAIEQNAWLKALARHTGVDQKALVEESEKLEVPEAQSIIFADEPAASPEEKKFSRWELLCQRTLSQALASGSFDEVPLECLTPAYVQIGELLKSGVRSSPDPEVDALLNLVVLRVEELSVDEAQELFRQLKREWAKEKRLQLTASIRQAEAKGDEGAVMQGLQELSKLPAE